MKLILAFVLAAVTLLSGCAVSAGYSGVRIIPSPQEPAAGTQKLCTVPAIGGSSSSSGQYSSSVSSSVQECTWVNANGQNCRSIQRLQYRSEFYPKVEGQKARRPDNNSNYRWECR